jgi:hypothetical protein
MPVPEAAVEEHNGAVFWQDDVGPTGQFFSVQAEAVTGAVQGGAHQLLWRSIAAADTRHVPAAAFWGQPVSQRSAS